MTRRASAAASLSCAAMARELGVAPNTVRHWCREGWLRKHAKVTEGGSYQIPRRVFDAILAGELSPPKPQRRG
jgi:uncharacterized protein YjcR